MKRLLIANRAEIALRINRAARELGLETVQVFSDVDAGSQPVRAAHHRIALGGSAAKDTYLNQEKLIAACIQSGADALHPGYGFLAENAGFAHKVTEAGICFVGPSAEAIAAMGDKHQARLIAKDAGVPLLPVTAAGQPLEVYQQFVQEQGLPVIIKAVAGGSGRGMRLVEKPEELVDKLEEAQREASSAFGRGDVYVERYLPKPRHIEVQVFADSLGTVCHLGERECSVQRRHQKLIEESPAFGLHPKLRTRMLDAACLLTKKVKYLGAGTVEFLVDDGSEEGSPFYFLEMNTRIQVEHPVTEMVFGIDLVKEQLRVAMGEPLSFTQAEVKSHGHAIEFRLYAENVREGFKPCSGKLRYLSRANGPWIREDSWIESGASISSFYDSLISKISVWGRDRAEALARSVALLDTYVLDGFPSTLDFHRWILQQKIFTEGCIDVNWIAREYKGETKRASIVGPLQVQNVELEESSDT